MAGDTRPAQGDGEPEFSEAQLAEAERLMAETPRIQAALKNFLSLKMARVVSPAEAGGEEEEGLPASQAALQGCARVLMKALNGLELPPAPVWSQRRPQGEQEMATDFMDRIGRYKVVHNLWTRCRAAGQKPGNMLGRGALAFALPEAREAVMSDAAASAGAAGAAEDELEAFMSSFAETMQDDSRDAELVWAADMNAVLAARREARQAEAAERVRRAATADSFSEELRNALTSTSAGDPGSSTGVQIEEVHD